MSVRQTNFWNWGWDDNISPEDPSANQASALSPPKNLAQLYARTPDERLTHSLKKSFADLANAALRQVPRYTDVVAFPETEADVKNLIDWAGHQNEL